MRLRQLLDPGVVVEGRDNADPQIRALTADSRNVDTGTLFAALAGARTDGRRYIHEALKKGAAAILADPTMQGRDLGIPLILDPEPRRRLALIASRFFQQQPTHTVAVTGTNGKTSVVSFVRQLWQAIGLKAASLGTLGLEASGLSGKAGLTTPDPVGLHRLLSELAETGTQHLALEASSHGLDQHRLDGVMLKAAAFTNLSRDHLDYHGSFEAYFAAKARLFEEILPDGGKAVLNADIPEFGQLSSICRKRGLEVIAYGREGDDIKLLERRAHADGQDLAILVRGETHLVKSPLVGGFQVSNLLATLGLVLATTDEYKTDQLVAALGNLEGVRGRLQSVDGSPRGLSVFVDYAHTPDALAHVLDALRPHTEGALMVVFGCGGDRDPGKRPAMGRIAAERADKVFVTDDNPRSEDAALIRRAVLEACPDGVEVGDRREAIHLAVRKLGVGDILVVAGKGHETGQIVGDKVLPFDDVAVVKAALPPSGKISSNSRALAAK
ncbi:MAG: UDP-N-acetylmuramoyl-L-alanyl-D-glutamate--2,6-diaminopimelate ligase [Geminicoccaceae bacterium]